MLSSTINSQMLKLSELAFAAAKAESDILVAERWLQTQQNSNPFYRDQRGHYVEMVQHGNEVLDWVENELKRTNYKANLA